MPIRKRFGKRSDTERLQDSCCNRNTDDFEFLSGREKLKDSLENMKATMKDLLEGIKELDEAYGDLRKRVAKIEKKLGMKIGR